ncbi:MAG TPA: class I SAM-dependent methyltransferase [Thermoanaerobaculia bacterium]|nr:class I SAM-dependent methyltransferase [Thermoanaerobaculia bacterium]
MTYWDDLARHHGGECIDEIWLNHPLVRAEANRLVSGDAAVWPTQWLKTQVSGLTDGVSIGCGTGAFERDVVPRGVVSQMIGIDEAHQPLERATRLAVEAGLADRIEYVQTDANQWLKAHPNSFDAVFFHASLHHFARPAEMLATVCSALRPGGWLYLDEYIGPARDEWSLFRLALPNLAYRLLPFGVRRPWLVRAPINREDPTEAIASSSIVTAVRQNFDDVRILPYGGNLLSVVYPNLHRTAARFDAAVSRLITFERMLRRLGAKAYYAVILARTAPIAETMSPTSSPSGGAF